MRRPILQFGNFVGDAVEILALVEQSGAEPDVICGSGVHSFAEPESSGVIFLGVIDRLKGLGADALYIPQMEELVGRDAGEDIQTIGEVFGR